MREQYLRAIAEIYIVDQGLLLQPDPCPDQDVGMVDEIIQTQAFDRHPVGDRDGHHRVILILESPHSKEFIPPIGPARGTTGVNIRHYLLQVPGLEDVGKFKLILMNPVQYQCSLGAQPIDARRTKIFMSVWERGGRQDFQERLQQYVLEGDRVVNCCTAEPTPGGIALRDVVQDAIQDILPGQPVLRRVHPATWNIPAQRNREW